MWTLHCSRMQYNFIFNALHFPLNLMLHNNNYEICPQNPEMQCIFQWVLWCISLHDLWLSWIITSQTNLKLKSLAIRPVLWYGWVLQGNRDAMPTPCLPPASAHDHPHWYKESKPWISIFWFSSPCTVRITEYINVLWGEHVCSYMWPDLWRGTLICFSKCVYFKEAYFRNAMRNLNQTRVFYRGGVSLKIVKNWKFPENAS